MIKIEFERIRRNWKLVLIFSVIFILSFYFVFAGIASYKRFLIEKDKFLQYENKRVELSLSYAQYGANGVTILYCYSPLIVFFNSKNLAKITANLNTSEILDVVQSKRGESQFFPAINFKGFHGFIFFCGIILHFYLGWSAFNNPYHLRFAKRFNSTFSVAFGRLIFGLIFFSILYLLVFIFACVMGIFGDEILKYALIFFKLSLFSLGVFVSCYLWGQFISILIENRKVALPILIIVVVVFCSFVQYVINVNLTMDRPGEFSEETVKTKKLERLLSFEKVFIDYLKKNPNLSNDELAEAKRKFSDSFMMNEYKKNEKLEMDFLEYKKVRTKNFEKVSILFPIAHFDFLSEEVSGNGKFSLIEFIEYALKKRFEFVSWILKKRFNTGGGAGEKVEPFFEGEKVVYYPSEDLRKSFFACVGIIILNIIFACVLAVILIMKRLKYRLDVKTPDWKLIPGNFYYKIFENTKEKNQAFKSFKDKGDTICVDQNIGAIEPYLGCSLGKIKDICFKIDADENRFERILRILVDFEIDWKTKIEKDILKKVCLAINLSISSMGKNKVVLNEYIKNESVDFDEKFRRLINLLLSEGKSVLYLSCNMFQFKSEEKEIKKSELMKIDIESVILR
jgi:hypothetical protein